MKMLKWIKRNLFSGVFYGYLGVRTKNPILKAIFLFISRALFLMKGNEIVFKENIGEGLELGHGWGLVQDTPPQQVGEHKTAALAALVGEFLRYAVVGGVAFLVDFGVLVAAQEFLFKHFAAGVYLSTVCGFLAGLVVNYILSLIFVFIRAKDRGKGRSVGAFLVFGVIGALGLLWTELGMWLGVAVLEFDYRLVKVFVTAAVLLWNYLGRKLIIFR